MFLRMERVVPAFVALLLSVLLISGCAGPQQFKTQLFQGNDTVGWGPNGLAWNGRDLIVGEGAMIMDITAIETGAYISKESEFTSNGFFLFARDPEPLMRHLKVCGLAWEGECCGKGFLWVADALNKEIIKVNAKNEIVKRLPSPGDSPSGMAFDGKYLWVSDNADSRLYKVSPDDGSVLQEFSSPVEEPAGLAWDCSDSRLWITGTSACTSAAKDCYTNKLVKLDAASGKVTHEVSLPKHMVKPSALEWVDGILWVGDYNLNRVFKVAAKGDASKDASVYTSEVTVRPRRVIAQTMSPEEEARLIRDMEKVQAPEAQVPAARAVEAPEARARAEEITSPAETARAAEEARAAAEEAKAAAEEAKAAAGKAEKAFELQLKK